MYSATFAMTVIIGIALTNLFLGFAAAMLLGRGPRRWLDVDRAIVLQPFSLDLVLPGRRPKVERVDLQLVTKLAAAPPEPEPPAASEADPNAQVETATIHETPTVVTEHTNAQLDVPPSSQENATPPQRLVLSVATPEMFDPNEPPEKTLNHQLDTWRDSDQNDETPSISGLNVAMDEMQLDDDTCSRLTRAIHRKITAQLRRDRRVLQTGPRQFAWFSYDVPAKDALMPVERIRQMLEKTRFHHQGLSIDFKVTAGVAIGFAEDEASDLLKRLNLALQCATEKGETPTCLDEGEGPKFVPPMAMEIEAAECDLDG